MSSVANASDAVVLGRRQLYMLPTRHGLMFCVLLAVLLLASVNYGNGLGYALTFLLGAVAVVSMLHTHRNLHRLRVAAGPCVPVFAGATAVFRIQLINEAPLPRLGVRLERGGAELGRVDIAPRAAAHVDLAAPAPRRGWLAAPEFTLATEFPLGLLYSWSRRIRLASRCLVYPQPAPPQPFPAAAAESVRPEQNTRAGGDDFIGVREFHWGDSPRHVDWKASARAGDWLTKQFGDGLRRSVWLDWNALAGLETEARLSLLARWVLDAESSGLSYGLRLPGRTIAPGAGAEQRHDCLKALALHPG
ncbi:MAG: hypothetical protein A3B81_00520 [Candidatus Muproteobacteria bacterium RIFCSPHIGHO2_02_FULL_65_16]|uniref:Uncharacterized protein n=1 Tax=Candidatus Muproteobacteria bacterium RIFCSPHIGHO2_02_FULL_65_16 TaxID=1817766 RepID=A0A1F6U320_9PROT|nr:MAG: hypothetical protein A3B81_00520 [Candidatus Muproteobacteria bacterium RIFCSPHIGHO2_02_FULL_65_16]